MQLAAYFRLRERLTNQTVSPTVYKRITYFKWMTISAVTVIVSFCSTFSYLFIERIFKSSNKSQFAEKNYSRIIQVLWLTFCAISFVYNAVFATAMIKTWKLLTGLPHLQRNTRVMIAKLCVCFLNWSSTVLLVIMSSSTLMPNSHGVIYEVQLFTLSTDINFATIALQGIEIMLVLSYLFSLVG